MTDGRPVHVVSASSRTIATGILKVCRSKWRPVPWCPSLNLAEYWSRNSTVRVRPLRHFAVSLA